MIGDHHNVHGMQKNRLADPPAVQENTVAAVIINDRPAITGVEKSRMMS
jgi:hypothetical protein